MIVAQMLHKSICTITDLVAIRYRAWMSEGRNMHLPKVADEGGFAVESTRIKAAFPSAVQDANSGVLVGTS